MYKSFQRFLALVFVSIAIFIGIYFYKLENQFVWCWMFGIAFGVIMQTSRLCFVSAATEPHITSSTEQLRAILIGILTSSLGITLIKYFSNGTLDSLGVSAISIPLILGATIFGIGMVLCGCCSVGMFVRLAEGYIIHIVTIICVIIGYLFANSHYQSLWAPLIVNAPAIFLPLEIGWSGAIISHIVLVVLIYLVALKIEQGTTSSNSTAFLKGGIFLGLFVILHYLVLGSSWSVTGAFFWFSNLSYFQKAPTTTAAFSSNVRNIGIFVGALISALFFTRFKIQKIRSAKQLLTKIIGGVLMGYGACIASGCSISAFFISAASLSLSAWVFMICLFIGAYIGLKILYKLL